PGAGAGAWWGGRRAAGRSSEGTWAEMISAQEPATSSELRLAAGDPPERLHVAVERALDHVGRELRWRRLLVPARLVEPVADELLVERGGLLAGQPVGDVPVAGGVRGEDLVDQQQVSRFS